MRVESYAEYCHRERSALVALAYRLTGSSSDAEDLAHDVLLGLGRRWSDVGGLDHLDAYARRAVINLSKTRHKRSVAARAAIERLARRPTTVELSYVDDASWAHVRSLPGHQPEVVALRVLENRTHSEIAAILGMSEVSVRQTYSRARRTLATLVGAR